MGQGNDEALEIRSPEAANLAISEAQRLPTLIEEDAPIAKNRPAGRGPLAVASCFALRFVLVSRRGVFLEGREGGLGRRGRAAGG